MGEGRERCIIPLSLCEFVGWVLRVCMFGRVVNEKCLVVVCVCVFFMLRWLLYHFITFLRCVVCVCVREGGEGGREG